MVRPDGSLLMLDREGYFWIARWLAPGTLPVPMGGTVWGEGLLRFQLSLTPEAYIGPGRPLGGCWAGGG